MSATLAEDELTTMATREAPPTHFLIKIESFYSSGCEKYQTMVFVAGDYKWRLIIYPNGDNNVEKDRDYVSVYLAMVDTSSVPSNSEVNAVFSIFLLNHNSGKYLSSLGRTRRFQGVKSEWGIPKFISKKTMLDPSNGYLVNDSCVFGAEVFVVKRQAAVVQCLCLKNFDIPYKRNWMISNFSKLQGKWESEEFSAGGYRWKICLHPKGIGDRPDRHVSIFLENVRSEVVKATFTICIKNQLRDLEDEKLTATKHLFTASDNDWGWKAFVELATITDPRRGFVVQDCCLLEVEISFVQDVAQN